MIKVAIAGVAGQMGRTLVKLITEADDMKVVAGYEGKGHPELGNDIGNLVGVGPLGISAQVSDAFLSHPSNDNDEAVADILVDFAIPDLTLAFARGAARRKMGLVIGTTGQSESDLAALDVVASDIPLLRSPNMSVGVNIAFKLIEMATRAMGDETDIEIYEIHHKLKIDSPSGTAVRMGEIVAETREQNLNDVALYGREGNTGRRVQGSLGFHSARGGDVVGEHTVTFAGTGERIEITHRAQSRVNFASGALRAIRYIYTRWQNGEVGSFSMNRVLGLD